MELTSKRLEAVTGGNIYGFGAALMLPVLKYYIKSFDMIKYIIDEDLSKKGLYYLNVPIQIKMLDEINNIQDSVALITAINSMQAIRAILNKTTSLNIKKIIIPLNLI